MLITTYVCQEHLALHEYGFSFWKYSKNDPDQTPALPNIEKWSFFLLFWVYLRNVWEGNFADHLRLISDLELVGKASIRSKNKKI